MVADSQVPELFYKNQLDLHMEISDEDKKHITSEMADLKQQIDRGLTLYIEGDISRSR